MAHQFSSPSSGSSSAQHQGSVLSSAPASAHQTSLDLNLSQKASQNPFRSGHNETASSYHKAFEASTTSQLDTGLKASEVLASNANGCTLATSKNLSAQATVGEQQEHTHGLHPLQKQDADSVRAASRTGLNGTLVTAADDGLPVASESASIPAGQKRRSPRVEAASNAQKELRQGGTVTLVENASLLVVNEPMPASPAFKRKSPRVKQTTSDTSKKVILALEANEDEGLARPRGRPRNDTSKEGVLDTPRSRSKSAASKSGSPDLAERRLLLEERKIRLAEQRFLLEEKKLDATIEIGKGLIISMERMTNTITQLGNSSRSHR